MASMKWYHIAILVACMVAGAVVGVIVSHMFHVTIWIAPVIAVANGVSVYYALKRRIDAKGS
jgi:uncharacterized membrane protein